ncbi:MAG: hypothetical protein V2I48_06270 [Xanthomonadales bacterium]|nr:hypothetical protein [Xanthomonadales bacterium]
MSKMIKTAVAVSSVMFLVACSPGMYTGGGWADTAGPGDSKASFGFSVESCDTEAAGHFNLADEGWDVPVEISGHIMDFGELGDFGDNCNFYALLEYVSANPELPGEGHAVVCFGNDNETADAERFGQVWVTVQSGPFEGYENYGPIYSNVQSHQCDS